MDLRTWGTVWAFLCFVAGCSAQTEEEDEKRPYKFAFNIEGYQHRSEEKDERGIINGEYGFVTGDGVYHVTVYATDENGDFKIISIKNYYIGLPGQETTTTRATEPPRPRVTSPPPPPPTPSYTTTISPIIQHLNGLMGCSGCIIPEKNTTKTPGASFPEPESKDDIDIRVDVKSPEVSSGVSKRPLSSVKPSSVDTSYMGVQYVHFNDAEVSSTTPCSDCGITTALRPSSGSPGLDIDWKFGEPPSVTSGGAMMYLSSGQDRDSPEPPSYKPPEDNGIPEVFKEIYSARPNSQGDDEGSRGTLQQSGNPNFGSPTEEADSEMFAQDLLEKFYQFHYILRYNGHNETGYRNGVKEGDYFVNGRDGLGRNVKYVANEFGYQPNITLVKLGLESPDTPKEQGEEPNELKSSEFTWFYGS